MERLFDTYSEKVLRGDNEFKMFKEFFSVERESIEDWLDVHMKDIHIKNNNKAAELKAQGNTFYANENFRECIDIYTRALCYAECNSHLFGVILSNRSSGFFMIEDYKNCLKDIGFCLKAKCSNKIFQKVYIRKVKCYARLNLDNELRDSIMEALKFIGDSTVKHSKDKDDAIQSVFEASVKYHRETALNEEPVEDLPKLKDAPNSNFLDASSAVCIDYDEQLGRHVRANKDLKPGDVLFVEKPFVFASVFINENRDLPFNNSKCYNCLSTALSGIPCDNCTCCMFCDEDCRDNCWNESHKWECPGMQTNLWYEIGIAFPAFRALIKGLKSGLNTSNSDFKADTITYGDESDNYPYFNKLISNVNQMKNVLPLVLSATIVTLYLKNKTDFFGWLIQQPKFSNGDWHLDKLLVFFGGSLTKHIAQFQCNSSTIFHENLNSHENLPVACAIYPSISIMNHSCKPNINIRYVRDIAIVQAAEEIEANEEISNCYGIDYRYNDRKSRQEHLRSQYYFDCKCRACKEHM